MKPSSKYQIAFAAAAAAMFVMGAPVRASEADDQIEAAFKETYVHKTFLQDDAIKAKANAGVVTLTGTVAEESHKGLAHETVASLPGVTRVDNQLTTEAEADAENADKWIGRKVKLSLLFHRNVNGGNTTVDVQNGVVTLTGEASSMAQKELTAEYARDIEGVVDVVNELTVVATPEALVERTPGQKIDDASITAQVKTALAMHQSTRAVKTKVGTRDGVVSLTGIVKNDAEKALISKMVNDIQGVASVKNEMTVQAPKAY